MNQFPAWLLREKARNLNRIKIQSKFQTFWKSWAECAVANMKRIHTLVRHDTGNKFYQVGWRLSKTNCVNSIRQRVRLINKQWQVRYYIEARKMKNLNSTSRFSDPLFQVRAHMEVSRLKKILPHECKRNKPSDFSWSLSGKRAYEKINHIGVNLDRVDKWKLCFKQIEILNIEFHKLSVWDAAFRIQMLSN